VVASGKPCSACGRVRGFVYEGPVYSAATVESLCPWCIADGTAATKFDAMFVASLSPIAFDEVVHRTPGYDTWQEDDWPIHCGDAAAFLGHVGYRTLADHHSEVQEALRTKFGSIGWRAEHVEEFLRGLDPQGSPTAYLFRCLLCGVHLGTCDFD
jgi:uncharacterized protein CbrC (UPF0167 family)